MARSEGVDPPTPRGALLLALGVSIVVGNFVPFGGFALYPFTLMATWVHEMGHGVAALIVGGAFDRLQVFADASGLAHTRHASDWRSGVVSVAGLLAPPLVGALVLGTSRGDKRSRLVLAAFSIAMLASCVLWVRNVAGWIAVPLVGLAIGAVATWGSARERLVAAQFLGLRLASDTITRIDYAWAQSATVDGRTGPSDIATVAAKWGGPSAVWSILVTALSFALVALGLWAAWWRPAPRASQRS
jgi:hypothetical protein